MMKRQSQSLKRQKLLRQRQRSRQRGASAQLLPRRLPAAQQEKPREQKRKPRQKLLLARESNHKAPRSMRGAFSIWERFFQKASTIVTLKSSRAKCWGRFSNARQVMGRRAESSSRPRRTSVKKTLHVTLLQAERDERSRCTVRRDYRTCISFMACTGASMQ